MEKIYRHIYDDPREHKSEREKPNEFLGEFEIIEGNTTGYDFEAIGVKNGKKYKIFGVEVTATQNGYNAGTQCYVELIEN